MRRSPPASRHPARSRRRVPRRRSARRLRAQPDRRRLRPADLRPRSEGRPWLPLHRRAQGHDQGLKGRRAAAARSSTSPARSAAATASAACSRSPSPTGRTRGASTSTTRRLGRHRHRGVPLPKERQDPRGPLDRAQAARHRPQPLRQPQRRPDPVGPRRPPLHRHRRRRRRRRPARERPGQGQPARARCCESTRFAIRGATSTTEFPATTPTPASPAGTRSSRAACATRTASRSTSNRLAIGDVGQDRFEEVNFKTMAARGAPTSAGTTTRETRATRADPRQPHEADPHLLALGRALLDHGRLRRPRPRPRKPARPLPLRRPLHGRDPLDPRRVPAAPTATGTGLQQAGSSRSVRTRARTSTWSRAATCIASAAEVAVAAGALQGRSSPWADPATCAWSSAAFETRVLELRADDEQGPPPWSFSTATQGQRTPGGRS